MSSLDIGLAPEVLEVMAQKARESLGRPGVPVEIPSAMAARLEQALEGMLTEQLVVLREQVRAVPADTFEFRIRSAVFC